MPSKASNTVAQLSAGWVSLNKAAKLLGISYPTATRLRQQGRIKTIRIGGVFRVYADELRRIMREGTNEIVADVEEVNAEPEEQLEEESDD